ncbi:MBL fold metallo-hydrolase [Parapedobacter tibetensis]|uniref:MBL fold metallo-hydrolase n=1 Tax=Parapedobacter tibetensis TaxID=2972951 RepID=UPI00214D2837|nr:MBL fold metallo-hydrolase [Parapedobacter tibetensis]
MGNILPDFLVHRPEGYYCRYGDFYIDPIMPVNHAIVSHAHADHASPGHGLIYCTPSTAIFMKHRYNRRLLHSFLELPYHQSFAIGLVAVRFVPAGHILGSAQIALEYEGVRYLYTGDYKLQADDTCEPLETVQADVLITESTFADPLVSHPDPVSEIKKLNDTPFNVLLGTYALGKAQRLTALINKHCPDRRILVHYGILPIHRIYENNGVSKMDYEPYNRKEMKSGAENKVYMVPPMTFKSYYRATGVVRVFASGWKRLQQHNDMELYISDHVDWNDILNYVGVVKPREIWTIHGDGRHLATYFAGDIPVKII